MHGNIAGIGLGVAGLIDRKNGRVFSSPNHRAVEGLNLVEDLQREFNLPVYLENDANVAALGEKVSGAGKNFENFILLTLGAGIVAVIIS